MTDQEERVYPWMLAARESDISAMTEEEFKAFWEHLGSAMAVLCAVRRRMKASDARKEPDR